MLVHAGKYRTEEKIKNTDNTETKHNPEKANGAKHSKTNGLIEQCFTSPPTQYRLYGRRFYRSKDPTNSIKVLKEKATKEKSNNGNNKTHIHRQ